MSGRVYHWVERISNSNILAGAANAIQHIGDRIPIPPMTPALKGSLLEKLGLGLLLIGGALITTGILGNEHDEQHKKAYLASAISGAILLIPGIIIAKKGVNMRYGYDLLEEEDMKQRNQP